MPVLERRLLLRAPCFKHLLIFVLLLLYVGSSFQIDFITELAAFRNRRNFKSRLESLFPTQLSGRCIVSSKSGRDICYPDLNSLDYSCVSKDYDGRKSVPPPRIAHGQYKALVTKFRPYQNQAARPQGDETSGLKPYLVVQYECNTGYVFLDEAEFLFCREYKWHQTLPVCVPSNLAAEYRRKENPCRENNGGCSHICKQTGQSTVACECPENMVLQVDGRTCAGKSVSCRCTVNNSPLCTAGGSGCSPKTVVKRSCYCPEEEADPCLVDNGGCSHFCTVTEDTRQPKCDCPDGFVLRSDQKTCGEVLETLEFLPEKPGICPQVQFGFPDQKCASYCRRDQDCTGKQKCCSNGCANVCLDPEPGSDLIQRPIIECGSTEGCRCVVLDEIRQRCQCPLGVICHLTRSAPEVTISPPGPIEIRPGAPLNLTCNAAGFPFPNLTWYKDNAPMTQNSGVQNDKTTTKRLLIKELFKSTIFTCEAVNDVGGSSAEVQVIITGPGSPPGSIQAKVSGTTVTIRWAPPALPNGRIKGYQVYYIANDARKHLREWKTAGTVDPRIILTDLEPQTRYFFRVMPYNERGSGIMTNIFSVKTEKREVVPVAAIVEGPLVEVEPGESVNLTCKVESFPPAQVSWYQNGNRLNEASIVPVLRTSYESALESSVFECRAVNSKGFGNATVKVDVMGPGTAPGQIQHRVDGNNIELSWGSPQFPNGEILGYTVYYTTDPNLPVDKWPVELVMSKQTFTFKDLEQTTAYFFRIKAFNEKGPGPLSDTRMVLTGKKSIVPKVRLHNQPQQIEVNPFGQVNITCVAHGIPEPSVSWKQDGEVLRSFSQPGPGEDEISKSIVIERIVENTAFTCEASNTAGSDTLKVDVLVKGPGSPPENIEVNTFEDTMHLKWQQPYITNGNILGYNIYYTTNRSLPMSSWQRFTVPSSGYQSQAIMHDLEEDTTYYVRISGYTNLGEGVLSQPSQAKVGRKLFAPQASLKPGDSIVSINYNETYVVTCTADGYPQPKLVWYRDDIPVGFRTISESAKSISAVLTVENLLKSSRFQCRAENGLGVSIKEIFIEIKGPGSPPTAIKYLPYSTNIELMWEPPEIPNGNIIGYEIAYTTEPNRDVSEWEMVSTGSLTQHKLSGLLPTRPYTIQIRAVNEKGSGPWTSPFVVETGHAEAPPNITVHPDLPNLSLAPGSTLNLTCSADGFPEPMVTWLENGHPVSAESGSHVNIIKENVIEPAEFECKAVNLFGVVSKSIKIDVTGPGEPPLRLLCDTKGRTVHVSWLPPRITNGKLQGFVIYYSKDLGANISQWESVHVPAKRPGESPFYDMILTELPPMTTFYIRGQAISEKGPGVISAPISVTTQEQDFFINATVEPGEYVKVPLNGGAEINCIAEGFPTPMVSWQKGENLVVSPKPNVNTIFLDAVSSPANLDCHATSEAGTVVKSVHVFPSEQMQAACKPIASLVDGNYLLSWRDLKQTVVSKSNYSILYTTNPILPLHLWSSIENVDPKGTFFPNLEMNQKYYVRMKITDLTTDSHVICDTSALIVPTLPKQMVMSRAKNRTTLNWGKINIPDKNIEKIHVYYTYEVGLPFEQWEHIVVPASAEEIALPDIKPSTDYFIKLEFVTDQGEKLYSLQYEIKSPDFEYTKCELAKCDHECNENEADGSAVCSCRSGYVLDADGKTCLEQVKPTCADGNGGCEQECLEKEGGVECACREGFVLAEDQSSCQRITTITTTPTAEKDALSPSPGPADSVCSLPMEIGSCTEQIPAWYYDSEINSCYQFNYGGCEGNENRFETRSQCMDRCSDRPCHKGRLEAIREHKTYLPSCDDSGNFAPLQCDAFNNCWCSNPETGAVVPGTKLTAEQGKPYCSSCKHDYTRLLEKGDDDAFIPSCTDEGHYNLVQCHAATGECWCVDQLTGAEVLATRVPAGVRISCNKPPFDVKPENLRVAQTDDGKLKFVFDLPKNVTIKKFIVYYAPDDDQVPQKWNALEIDKSFSDSGFERPNFLQPNRTYAIKIAAVVDSGLGDRSDTVKVDNTIRVPPQTSIIRIENLTPTSGIVKWDRNPDIDSPSVKQFSVYIQEVDSGGAKRIQNMEAFDEIPLTFEPNTHYAVAISAVSDEGRQGPLSNWVEFKTPREQTETEPQGQTQPYTPGLGTDEEGLPLGTTPGSTPDDLSSSETASDSREGSTSTKRPGPKCSLTSPSPGCTRPTKPGYTDQPSVSTDGIPVSPIDQTTQHPDDLGSSETSDSSQEGITTKRPGPKCSLTSPSPGCTRPTKPGYTDQPSLSTDGIPVSPIDQTTQHPEDLGSSETSDSSQEGTTTKRPGPKCSLTSSSPGCTRPTKPGFTGEPSESTDRTPIGAEPDQTTKYPGPDEDKTGPSGPFESTTIPSESGKVTDESGREISSTEGGATPGLKPLPGQTSGPGITDIFGSSEAPAKTLTPGGLSIDHSTKVDKVTDEYGSEILDGFKTTAPIHPVTGISAKPFTIDKYGSTVTLPDSLSTPESEGPSTSKPFTGLLPKDYYTSTTAAGAGDTKGPSPGESTESFERLTDRTDLPGFKTPTPEGAYQVKDTTPHGEPLNVIAIKEMCHKMTKPVDLIFAIDASDHVIPADYALVVNGVTQMIDYFFDLDRDAMKIGYVHYSKIVETPVWLGVYDNKAHLLESIQETEHLKGDTSTSEALFEAKDIFEESGRPDAEKVVVLISDGKSASSPNSAVQELRSKGIRLLAVALGDDATSDSIFGLISEPKNVFIAHDTVDFNRNIVAQVAQRVCSLTQETFTEPSVKPFTEPGAAGASSPAAAKDLPGPVNITRGQFIAEDSIEVEWDVEEPRKTKSFVIKYINIKTNAEFSVIVDGSDRKSILPVTKYEDHVIYIRGINDFGNGPMSRPLIVYKKTGEKFEPTVPASIDGTTRSPEDISHGITASTVPGDYTDVSLPTKGDRTGPTVGRTGEPSSESSESTESKEDGKKTTLPGQVPYSSTGAEGLGTPTQGPIYSPGALGRESTLEPGAKVSTEPFTGASGATDVFSTPSSVVYERFTTSIPAQSIEVAPKCNCTCQIVIKLKRGNCYYESEDGDDDGRGYEVIIDERSNGGQQVSSDKNCTDSQASKPQKERKKPEVDYTPLEEVPKDKESECPCVMPLRGDMCPPGFSLKSGKCRDINECAYKNGGCSHGCVNTVGAYYCACPPGMHRDLSDPKQCLDQESYFKRLGQLLQHHLWNEMKTNKARITADGNNNQTRQNPQTSPLNRAVARVTNGNGTNSVKFEWEWAKLLKRRRRL